MNGGKEAEKNGTNYFYNILHFYFLSEKKEKRRLKPDIKYDYVNWLRRL